MSAAGRARIVAYGLVCLIVGVTAPLAGQPSRAHEAVWPAAIERAQAALADGDAREARRHWEDAYRDAVHTRMPHGLLAVGKVSLQIGEAGNDRQSAVAEARRIYLLALFQARARRDPDSVALAGQAFASLGDREVADRAFDMALKLAISKHDVTVRHPVPVSAIDTQGAATGSVRAGM